MEVTSRRRMKHSIKDMEFDFDINDISRASTPTSTFSSKSEGRRREKNYSADDYRRKIARLKSELDMEKARNKKIHKDKSHDLKQIQEEFEMRQRNDLKELDERLQLEKKEEMKRFEEEVLVKKDKEIQQVLKYKEEEVRQLRMKYSKEKDGAIAKALETEHKKQEEKEKELQEQLKKLKEERDKFEQNFKKKSDEQIQKDKEFMKIKEEYDAELRRILGESKKLALGNLEKLRKAEKALSENYESDDESFILTELVGLSDQIASGASSRTVSRSLASQPDFLKLDEHNIDALLASVTPSPAASLTQHSSMAPSPASILSHGSVAPSPLHIGIKSRSSSVTSESSKELNRKLLDDKDRQLQKRVAELQAQIQRLERKIALLKTENETLKRKQDDKKPLEEKIKTLKKRNAELAAIARRLEEKAKHLQQENMKKTKEITGQHDTDHLKKMFARQRAKDLSEHAKSMLAKDREIEELRKKCQELADQLSNSDFSGPENVQMYEEREELVNIIKQAAKERLQLERQFAKIKPVPGTKVVDAEKYKELVETSETLRKEITKLQKALSETERLEIELTQKKLECERLSQDIEKEKKRSKLLETDLTESASQRTQLTVQVSDLQKRLQELEKVNEECSSLRLSLAEAQHECEVAKEEVTDLHAKVKGLETTVKNLEYSTEHLKQVEHDYQQALLTLQQKQAEIDRLQKIQEEARIKYEQAIKSLQDKIKLLEDLCHQQESNQRELTEELEQLRSQAVKHSKRELSTKEIQTGESIEFNPSSSQNSSHSRTPRSSPSLNISTQQSSKVIQVKANSNKNESAHSIKVNNDNHTDSSKSHDTGFAEDDLEDVTQSAEHSPEPDKNAFEDPELYEIAKKLKELEAEASDSAEETSQTDRGEDSGMDSTSNRENKGNRDGDASQSESRLSVLAKKGPIQVFMAKYSYDPYQHSPNDNPDAELPLNSGDYVLIYGEMDEDGFFDGELISGRRGLVPSNFIEKVADEDISEFHAAVAGAGHHDDDSTTANSIQQDLDFDSSEETDKMADIPDDRLKKSANQSSDTEDIEDNIGASFPRNLHLDRQLSNSILISWKSPDNLIPADIQSYQVYVNREFKMSVKGGDRTKALLEGIDSKQVHRVSVRCVSSKGTSDERSCTLKVGKDAVLAPCDLSVSEITANSAMICWWPGNSNYHHVVVVNGREVRVVRPGCFMHKLTGLSSTTSHTVRVKAKNIENLQEDDALHRDLLSSPVDFKTSAGGLPEPPLNVQVEPGPQEGNLLLTWLPVTIDTSGFSNGALVIGYVVFADGRRTKEAKGATNDHIVLSANDFQGFIPKVLMVRTLTSDGKESVDSEAVKLPHSLIKEITAGAAKNIATEVSHKVRKKSPIPVDGRDSDDEIDTAFREITQYAQVFGDKDADGFYRGESGGRVGYIPCNMVSEIRVEDLELQEQLLKETQENGGFVNSYMSGRFQSVNSINSNGVHLSPNPGHSLGIPDERPARKMIALYDYDPQELSPNVDADVELSFKTGDIIIIYGDMDDDGFYQGELNGMRGLVPSNFLQEYGAFDDEALESVSLISPARSGESINTTTSQKTDGNDKRPSPQIESSPVKVAISKLEPIETGTSLPNSTRSRSVSPEDVKQKQKKSGGLLSRGKNMFKKLTR